MKQVIRDVEAIADYHSINFIRDAASSRWQYVTDNFVNAVLKQNGYRAQGVKATLKSVYTSSWYRIYRYKKH